MSKIFVAKSDYQLKKMFLDGVCRILIKSTCVPASVYKNGPILVYSVNGLIGRSRLHKYNEDPRVWRIGMNTTILPHWTSEEAVRKRLKLSSMGGYRGGKNHLAKLELNCLPYEMIGLASYVAGWIANVELPEGQRAPLASPIPLEGKTDDNPWPYYQWTEQANQAYFDYREEERAKKEVREKRRLERSK